MPRNEVFAMLLVESRRSRCEWLANEHADALKTRAVDAHQLMRGESNQEYGEIIVKQLLIIVKSEGNRI